MIERSYSIEGQPMGSVSPPQDMIPVNDMKSTDAHFTIT